MSAVASQPRLATARVAVRVAVAPLTLVVVASAVLRIAIAWMRPSPAYFPDEYMYAEFSRSIAAGHLPAVRGASAHFLPLLQPLLTAPAWLLPGLEAGYRAAQAIDSIAMSLAAIPVYLLARRVGLGSRSALAAAVLSMTLPSLLFSGFIMSEPFAYPIVLGAVAAAVHALDRPGARSYGLFLGLTALAMFTRMQFAVIIPCFVLALVTVTVRERRVREFVRAHRIHIALLLLVSAALFAVGPARNTGYYPSFSFVPGFHVSTAAQVLVADALVLAFACGFVIVPGAILGLVLGLWRPRLRVELAFAAMTIFVTAGLLAEAVVYGHLDYIQERYLFYVLPLWTISFLLYAQQGWPRRTAHALVSLALVALALVVPLEKYVVADNFAHSPFLFALARLRDVFAAPSSGALAIVAAGAVGTLIVVAVSFLVPRRAALVAVAIAVAATVATSVGATSFDFRNARMIHDTVLGGHPTWVDDAHVGSTTMVVLPGSRLTDATLFWNRSIDRLVLFPRLVAPDSFAVNHARIERDGTVVAGNRPVRGSVVLGNRSTFVQLRDASVLQRTNEQLLVRSHGPLRLKLMVFGRYSDGWLDHEGVVLVWPDTPHGTLSGRLVLPVRPPRGSGPVTLIFYPPGGADLIQRTAPPGRLTNVVVPVCSIDGPVGIKYTAGPAGSVGDGRSISATTGKPRFVPDGHGC